MDNLDLTLAEQRVLYAMGFRYLVHSHSGKVWAATVSIDEVITLVESNVGWTWCSLLDLPTQEVVLRG